MDGITDSMDINLSKLLEIVKVTEACELQFIVIQPQLLIALGPQGIGLCQPCQRNGRTAPRELQRGLRALSSHKDRA